MQQDQADSQGWCSRRRPTQGIECIWIAKRFRVQDLQDKGDEAAAPTITEAQPPAEDAAREAVAGAGAEVPKAEAEARISGLAIGEGVEVCKAVPMLHIPIRPMSFQSMTFLPFPVLSWMYGRQPAYTVLEDSLYAA